MFKKFSKLMLLAIGVLTVSVAWSDDGSGSGTPLGNYLEEVGGKTFDLVTGSSNLVSATTGDIMNEDGTVLYKLEVAHGPNNATYTKGAGNYFGVEYDGNTKPLKFYFAKTSTKPNGDYWTTAAAVKYVAGDNVLLAAQTPNGMFINGPFTDNVTDKDDEVPTTGAISAVLAMTSATDIKLYALADNKTSNGTNKGTLFTGTIDLATFRINITKSQVAGVATEGMQADSLQMVSASADTLAPVIINKTGSTISLYDTTGTSVNVDSPYVNTLTGDTYVAGVSYIAVKNNNTTKLRLITVNGFLSDIAAFTLSTMIPTSIVPFNEYKNILVAGYQGGAAVIDNVTLGDAGTSKVTIPVTGLGSSVTDIELVVDGADLYAVVSTASGAKLYKFDGTKWTVVTAVDHEQNSVAIPTKIKAVRVSATAAGSIMYITSIEGTTSTTTAYMVTPTVLVKIVTPIPTVGKINNIVEGVTPSIIALQVAGVLVIDAETIATKNVIRYNHFLTGDVPFQMPSID